MKLTNKSNLYQALNDLGAGNGHEVIPYIRKFMQIHPYAGRYEVDDRQYVSSVKDPELRHFHPSGDCFKCPRLMYWERDPEHYLQLSEDITPELQIIFKTGNAFHAMIQAWFSAWNDLDGFPKCIGNEVRIDDAEWQIGGFIDSVLRFPDMDEDVPIEIKSINSFQFSKLSEPLAAHKLQVGCYIMELGAPFGIVLYMDKNSGSMKEFRVEPMDMSNVLATWSKVRLAVKTKDISILDHGCKCGDSTYMKCPAMRFCK